MIGLRLIAGGLFRASRIMAEKRVAAFGGTRARSSAQGPRLSRIWSGRAESNCRPPGPVTEGQSFSACEAR